MLNRRQFLTSFACLAGLAAAAPMALAQSQGFTGSITSITPQTAISGKLGTKTENLAGRNEPAMLTFNSPDALIGAIAAYEEIVAAGGWPEVPKAKLQKGAKGPVVVTLRQRLVRENYLPFETLTVEKPGSLRRRSDRRGEGLPVQSWCRSIGHRGRTDPCRTQHHR